MLTLIEAISAAGDRAGQNDDAWGVAGTRAFVLDGATDLYDEPLTRSASDAAWIARFAAARLAAAEAAIAPRALIRRTIAEARAAFEAELAGRPWPGRDRLPITTLLLVEETGEGLVCADMGDSRLFALDAGGRAGAFGGGPAKVKDEEGESARRLAGSAGSGNARYRSPEALAHLREQRSWAGRSYFPLGVEPHAADHARLTPISLARPGHLLLCTDGFSALVDLYGAYDAGSLVVAARDKGLAALVTELRAIEAGDGAGEKHPRWKRSDDATALLVRVD